MSITIVSLVVAILSTLLKGADIDVVTGDLQTTVLTVVQVVGAVGVWWGRFRKGDLNVFGFRK